MIRFIRLMFLVPISLIGIAAYGQTHPGGVSGSLQLWLRADGGTSTTVDNSTVASWTDLSGGAVFNAVNTPSYQNDVNNLFNYNPTIDFDNFGLDHFSGASLLGTSAVTESAVYVVLKNNSFLSGGGLFAEKGAAETRFMTHYAFSDGTAFWHSIDGGGADWCRFTDPTTGQIELGTFEISQANDTKTINVNGRNRSNGGDQTFLALSGDNNPFLIGAAPNHTAPTPVYYADALVAEIAVYNGGGNVGLDRQKIESYLAVKYGITLDNTNGGAAGDYFATTGTMLWDASAHVNYHNDVIGIGRDDDDALLQKQSHTTDDTTRVYLNTLQTLNSSNAGSFSADRSYVLVGHNRGLICNTTLPAAEAPIGLTNCNLYSRLEREWKVQKTNFADNFNIDITLGACGNIGSVDPNHLRLLIDDDGDFSNGGTQCYYNGDGSGIIIGYTGTVIQVTNIANTHIANNSVRFMTIGSIDITTPLPVEFKSFKSKCKGLTVDLSWETSSESNSDYFIIEKSIDGISFDKIGEVKAAGNSSKANNYSFRDVNNLGITYYYRLKQVDFDGKIHTLETITSNCGKLNDFSMHPNPFQNTLSIELTNVDEGSILEISNYLGQIVYVQVIEKGQSKIEIEKSLPNGTYMVRLYNDEVNLVKKLIKSN